MIKEINQDNFSTETASGVHLVDVYGTHCGPCKSLAVTLEILDKKFPFLSILKLNADDNREFTKKNRILGVPTLFLIVDGEVLKRTSGALGETELLEFIGDHLYD